MRTMEKRNLEFGTPQFCVIRDLCYHLIGGECWSNQHPGCATVNSGISLGSHLSFVVDNLQTLFTSNSDSVSIQFMSTILGLRLLATDSLAAAFEGWKQAVLNCSLQSTSALTVCDLKDPEVIVLSMMHRIAVSDYTDLSLLRVELTRHMLHYSCAFVPQCAISRCTDVNKRDANQIASILEALLQLDCPKNSVLSVLNALGIQATGKERKEFLQSRVLNCVHDLKTRGSISTNAAGFQVVSTDVIDYNSEWPEIVPEEIKHESMNNFLDMTSSDNIREYGCCVCSESRTHTNLAAGHERINILTYDLAPLKGEFPPHFPINKDISDRLPGLSLDYRYLDVEGDKVMGRVCIDCDRDLRKGRLPVCSNANDLMIGPVPDELKDLTVVEEAMIARRRARCCIVQLHEDEQSAEGGTAGTIPGAQRGSKGHIIVFPAKPEGIVKLLPPPIEEVVQPLCVIFVGSERPSQQWLLENAKPLIIRWNKVWSALKTLKKINPLYSDVEINMPELAKLAGMGNKIVAPVHIDVQSSSSAGDAVGSRYDEYNDDVLSGSPVTLSNNSDSTPMSSNIFESVTVTDLDMKHASSNASKAAALKHMKQGGKAIPIGHDKAPVSEYNDLELLPLLFPTLFCYGTGGSQSARRRKISLERLGEHFINLHDRRFQEHYSFMFILFNIIQRRIASQKTYLRTKRGDFKTFASRLTSISDHAIDSILKKLETNDYTSAKTPEEKLVYQLMQTVQSVSAHIPGSAAARLEMRNEIRSLIIAQGLPTFFVTINPADVYNPIVTFMSGKEFDLNKMLGSDVPDYMSQRRFVAMNPFAAAKFFRLVMDAFIQTLLGTGSGCRGVFGDVKAYYGCVEAQGRGSLHCHMLVWLDGAPDIEQIRQRLLNDKDRKFGDKLLSFLEDCIQNEVFALSTAAAKSTCMADSYNALSVRYDSTMNGDERAKDLDCVIKKTQLHVHHPTCFKYVTNFDKKKWKGYPDHLCRFRISKSNERPESFVDSDTAEIHLRVKDGMVNGFNKWILQALRCNMDIKFIGSGSDAKAILYYITDYITKSQLTSHVSYSALRSGVKRMQQDDNEFDPIETRGRRLLLKCTNSIMGRQELSGQQVASYLMKYPDKFTSHRFRNLYWRSFEQFIDESERMINASKESPHGTTTDCESDPLDFEEVTVSSSSDGTVEPRGTQLLTYISRDCNNLNFKHLCVYDFVSQVDLRSGSDAFSDDNTDCAAASDGIRCSLDSLYPQNDSHFLAIRHNSHKFVPVFIGPALPKRESEECKEQYSRLMLILFKPWKYISDLKEPDDSWARAFELFRPQLSIRHLAVIENMQRLHECKQSRDSDILVRKHRVNDMHSLSPLDSAIVSDGVIDPAVDGLMESATDLETAAANHILDVEGRGNIEQNVVVNEVIKAGDKAGVFSPISSSVVIDRIPAELQDVGLDRSWRTFYENRKDADKQILRGSDEADAPDRSSTLLTEQDIELVRINTSNESLKQMPSNIVRLVCMEQTASDIQNKELVEYFRQIYTLNEEQAMAFQLVAMHSLQPATSSKPIRVIVHGPGGTGKSRVIDALRSFFDCRKESRRLRLAAYTGVASKCINGVTLHSALELRQTIGVSTRKKNLLASWNGVDYLIIDEMSMLGLRMMHSMDDALQIGKAVDSDNVIDGTIESFGNVSIMLAGDFCQLKPVGDVALFTAEDSLHSDVNASSTSIGQKKIKGKQLWSTFDSAVVLHQSMRQSGEANERFRELLHRVRFGNGSKGDVEELNKRRVDKVQVDWSLPDWRCAPALFGNNSAKDAWNAKCVERYAAEQGCDIAWYTARDQLDKNPVTSVVLKRVLQGLNTGKTKFLLGKLPLVEGMPVIIEKNFDVGGGVVNGTIGVLRSVRYIEGTAGERHATSAVVYVPDSSDDVMPGLGPHERVVLEDEKEFTIRHPFSGRQVSVVRKQLPLEPAYAMTVWKAQGRTLSHAIIDLESASDTASAYVMLSRVKSMHGLTILRAFKPARIQTHARQDVRHEVKRIEWLALKTRQANTDDIELQHSLQLEIDKIQRDMSKVGEERPPSRSPPVQRISTKRRTDSKNASKPKRHKAAT